MRRLFLALDLPDPCRDPLMALQEGLEFGREVPEENLHLTLAFLDAQPEVLLNPLHEMLTQIRCPAVRLELTGLDLFGGTHPSALVIQAERVPELIHLQEKVAQAARLAGMELPRRRFKPHVTLVRFARGLPAREREELRGLLAVRGGVRLPPYEAESFSLVESRLLPEGPRYERLMRYPLDPV